MYYPHFTFGYCRSIITAVRVNLKTVNMKKLKIASYWIIGILLLNTVGYSQEIIRVEKQVIVQKQAAVQQSTSATGYEGVANESFTQFLSKADIERITNEISDTLIKNYWDKYAVVGLVNDFQQWIKSTYDQDQVNSKEFVNSLTNWFRETTKDKHFIFQQVGKANAGAVILSNSFSVEYSYGISQLKWFPDGVGYINYNGFYPKQNPQATKVIDNAISFFENAHTLIIDLRKNYGGDGDMAAYFLSYFIPQDSIPLWTWEDRYNDVESSKQTYSVSSLPYAKPSFKKIYILVSHSTGSSAELFSHIIQSKKIGTLIGENTSGGVHTMATFPVADEFTFGLPNGRMIDVVSKEDIQKTNGIQPDFMVAAKDALDLCLKIIETENMDNRP